MSVRSKALQYGILVAVTATAAGCAIGPSMTEGPANTYAEGAQEEATQATGMVAESEIYGDMAYDAAHVDIAAADEANRIAGSMDTLRVMESEELLGGDSAMGVNVERGSGFSRFNIELGSAEPVVDVMMLAEPARLVVDVLGQESVGNREIAVDNDSFLKTIRVGAHHDRTRLVFDLNDRLAGAEQIDHVIDTATGRLAVTFLDASQAGSGMPLAEQGVTELAQPQMPEAQMPAAQLAEAEEMGEAEAWDVAELPSETTEEVVEVETVEPEQVAAAEAAAEEISLDALTFEKTYDDSGEVLVRLSDSAAFELRRTAPSEYVLSLPGVSAASRTTVPQIAPKSFPGIRSARAVQTGSGSEIRMFIDETVELQAFPRGNEIVIQASPSQIAANPQARAQLESPDAGIDDVITDETARRNPTGIRSADGSKIYTGRLISLDLQDTDIDNALRIIAEVSNLNIIASDDVSGKVTLRLIDVPWDQALDVILKTNGLDQVTEGNVIRIAPVDKLRQEREALREAKRAAENLEDLTVQYVRVSYARVGELVEQVATVLSERGSVIEDERTNQLIIKDIAKGHEQSIELIKRLDLRTPQVLLETQIVEGQRNILRDLGFQWNFTYIESPQTGNPTGNNFPNSITVGGSAAAGENTQMVNFPAVLTDAAGSAIAAVLDSADGSRSLTARLSTLETEGKVKVISRPQVATVNNKQAEIKSVETVRVRLPDSGTSVATGAGASAAGGGRTAFEEIDVGIELTVTPQASPDYYVLMDVIARSSTFGSTVVDNIPSTLEREATSTILVKSGQTFALGGIYRIEDTDQIQGVPFLKDIPFLGVLFRRSFIDKSDEELIFFITPHIVEGSFDPSLM